MEKNLSWEEFERVELCAGTIIEVQSFPEARRPAYKLWVDFGPLGVKKSSAQITSVYSMEELVGKQIVGVVNFPNKQIGTWMSEFLVTGFENEDGAIILTCIDQLVPNGSKLK